MLDGSEPELMTPWYKGFQGTINLLDGKPKNFYVSGVISEISGTEVEITDLPPGEWTQTYKDKVEISNCKLL
jgi:DNA topoisomerase-2